MFRVLKRELRGLPRHVTRERMDLKEKAAVEIEDIKI